MFAAAAELFDAQGYHQTTVDQIVKRANVAKGTFFLHFATKDAVIAELLRIQLRRIEKAREEMCDELPVERLRNTLLRLATISGTSRPLSRAVMLAALANPEISEIASSLHRTIFDYVASDAQEAQSSGELVGSVPSGRIAEALMSTCLGAALSFMLLPNPLPLLETLEPLIDSTIDAFSAKSVPVSAKAVRNS